MRFVEGDPVEVFVRDINVRTNTGPHWEPAVFVGITSAGFVQVKMEKVTRRKRVALFRAFSPDDVRHPQG